MELNDFSSKYDFKININDSSIKQKDVMSSLFHNMTIIDGLNSDIKNVKDGKDNNVNYSKKDLLNNLPENFKLVIEDEFIDENIVLESIYDNMPSVDLLNKINMEERVDNIKLVIEDDFIDKNIVLESIYGNIPSSDLLNNIKTENKTDNLNEKDKGNFESHIQERKIKINEASEEELKTVVGMRLIHAKKILQLRRHNVYINSFKDLKEKIGLDDEDIKEIKKYVTINKVTSNPKRKKGRILDI